MNSRYLPLRSFWLLFILLLLIVAAYANSLSFPFFFDDFTFFSNSGALAKFSHLPLEPRGLSYATLSWTVDWFGLDLFWLRAGNILLHAANALALFFLLRRLFQLTLPNDTPGGRQPAVSGYALLGAAIFALHPVAVYSVAYLIQRTTLMATFFVLLMLIVYLEGLMRGGWKWMLAAALCYFAAVFSKEHSIMAPGVALALTFLVRKPSLALLKQTAPYYLPILVTSVVILLSLNARGILGQAYEPHALVLLDQTARMHGLSGLADLPNPHLLSILTQSALFFKYLWLWILPNPGWMSVDMREPFAVSYISWPHTLGLVAFPAYLGAAVWMLLKRGKAGLLGFALLFPCIMFITEFSAVRIQEPFVLYRSYLWMPGLLATLPLAFGWLRPVRAYALLGVLCLLLVPLTLNRIHTFSSAMLLWDDAEKLVRDRPEAIGAARIYYNRGTELGAQKRYEEAIADFNKAIAVHPFDYLYGNRATAFYYLGRYEEALQDYDRAIRLNPEAPRFFSERAQTYRALGNLAAAREDVKRYCSLRPCNNM